MSEKLEKVRPSKKAQEHTQSTLPPHTLYIALYIRSDLPTPKQLPLGILPPHSGNAPRRRHKARSRESWF